VSIVAVVYVRETFESCGEPSAIAFRVAAETCGSAMAFPPCGDWIT
jgi:hypothetical protein